MKKFLLILSALFLFLTNAMAQGRTITGVVTDEKGNPLPNVSVVAKGSNVGTSSRADGTYTITIQPNTRALIFTSIDRLPQELPIGNSNSLNTVLRTDDKSLGEVVLTGYTTRRRSEFTGATAKVISRQIEQVPLASFEQILQGRAPGLYIASGSGQPGTSARVNIRGVGSFGNNDPLYVLDGIPIETGVFRSLNPNDFESVDVLKDAAGAGLYGSRGANGVIVITTKKGRSGRTILQYRTQIGYSEPSVLNNVTLQNTAQRLEYEEKVLGGQAGILNSSGATGFPGWDYSPNNPRYAGLSAAQKASEKLLLDSIKRINTDWPGIFFQKGKFTEHELSASGGSEGLNFYTSLSYYKQEGIVITSNLDRYTFRGNVDFKTKRLSVNVRSGAGFSSSNSIEAEAGVSLGNPIAVAFLELPYRRLYLPNGAIDTGSNKTGPNVYDRFTSAFNTSNQFKGNLGVTLQFDIWGGISFRTTNGVDWRNNNQTRFIKPDSYAGGLQQSAPGTRGQGLYGEGNYENLQLTTTTGFVFNRTYNNRHAISAGAYVEAIRNKYRSFSVTGYGINVALPNTPVGITGGSNTNGFIPFFGGTFLPGNTKSITGIYSEMLLAEYTYNRKYTVTGSIRNDAPSQVPKNNRKNIFWAASVGWNLMQENFMQNQNMFQNARLRASYGETGNTNGFTSDFGYISTYGSGSYAGVPAIVPTSPGNTEYKLESQVITNFGTDLSLFKNRIRITADYYIKDSRELFVNQNLSRTTGFLNLSTNAGKVRNSGFEFAINGDAVSSSDFLLTLGVNGAFNKNEVRSLGLLEDIPAGTGITRVGLSIGTHYTVGYLGVDPQSGLPVYEDKNGNPTTIYAAANNRASYGTFLPKFTGGATIDISWKGLGISTLFTTAQGVKRFNNESFFYESTNANATFNKSTDLLYSTWQKPGDMTNYQRISSPRQFSSRDIQDASYIRFRNLQVGYTITPENTRLFKGVRIWGQAQNLYTWTHWRGFDPEESNNIATYEFPNPRTYSIGLDLNF